MTEPHPHWLTIPEVAERLRYSTRTIQRKVKAGAFGPVLRDSNSVRIALEAVETFERKHMEERRADASQRDSTDPD